MPQRPHDQHAGKEDRVLGRTFYIACVVLCAITAGHAALAQYRSTQWTADSGLPQNTVRGIVQAPDGYIWVATLDGIARFDGIRFTVFNKSNTPGITSNRFTAMASGVDGDLWIPSEFPGKELGKFEWTAGKFYGDSLKDKGLKTSEDARFYALSAKFEDKKFNTEGKDLVIQFSG